MLLKQDWCENTGCDKCHALAVKHASNRCYQRSNRHQSCLSVQTVKKQAAAQFHIGVLKLDLSSAFDSLRHELGGAASGLDDLEAMAIDTDVQEWD